MTHTGVCLDALCVGPLLLPDQVIEEVEVLLVVQSVLVAQPVLDGDLHIMADTGIQRGGVDAWLFHSERRNDFCFGILTIRN